MKPLRWLVPWLLCLLAGCGGRNNPPASGGTVPVSSTSTRTAAPMPPQGTLRVSFLDVGQGDSAFVQVGKSGTLLIDGGPSEAGPRVLAALRQAGVKRLDWLVGSHPHEDHIGGLIDVLKEIPAAQALDPGYVHGTALQRKYLQLLKDGGTKVNRARAGQSYDLGSGARLEVLAPGNAPLRHGEDNANNHSIVARLVFGSTAFLFPGDMEEDERAVLLRNTSPSDLHAQVLKVAHHGSHNGTDPEFLRAVDPDYAVISLATPNDYGHPHREAMEALRAQGCRILRTDQQGTIVFTSDGKTVRLGGEAPAPAQAAGGNRAPAPANRPALPRANPQASAHPVARQGQVIGNRSSHVYHAPDCSSLPGPENRVVFDSAADARKAGYRPHARCMGAP